MELKFKKLNQYAITPTRGSEKAAGWDLYAMNTVSIHPHETEKIGTGIAVAIPDGNFGGIFARSGIATKQGLRPANCTGVVDSDYRGEVIVALHNDSTNTRIIEAGERIAQLIVMPFVSVEFNEVDELDETERGSGGFGSTGAK